MMDTVPRRGAAPLRAVIWFKIVFTLIAWCAPLLLVPGWGFTALGFPAPQPIIFFKLLGAAFLSLLVGYGRGLRAMRDGRSPADAVAVGIASNGLASALLLAYGAAGAFAEWGVLAQTYMWVSAAVTALITVGLFVFRPR